MPNKIFRWSPEVRCVASELWNGGALESEVAERIGCSLTTLRRGIHKGYVGGYFWSSERDAKLAEFMEAGLSVSSIAEKLTRETEGARLSRNAVAGRAFRLNLRFGGRIQKKKTGPAKVVASEPVTSRQITLATSAERFDWPADLDDLPDPIETLFDDVAAEADRITIMELGPLMCRWVVDEGRPGVLPAYCGETVKEPFKRVAGVYCANHFSRVFSHSTVFLQSRAWG